jgi:hypothetical protein
MLEEGWYLMSVAELERALRHESADPVTPGIRLSVEEAIAYRNAGNLLDEEGRSLRLVLHVGADEEPVARKRSAFEPDYQSAPNWKRPGSKPVNVVPLRVSERAAGDPGPWWEDPAVALLEEEWQRAGTVRGMQIPGEYRSFVYKTVLELEAAGKELTPGSIADSIARWVPAEDAKRIRTALENPTG